jgi:hypothetical protein
MQKGWMLYHLVLTLVNLTIDVEVQTNQMCFSLKCRFVIPSLIFLNPVESVFNWCDYVKNLGLFSLQNLSKTYKLNNKISIIAHYLSNEKNHRERLRLNRKRGTLLSWYQCMNNYPAA